MLFSKRGKILKKNIVKIMSGAMVSLLLLFGTISCSVDSDDENTAGGSGNVVDPVNPTGTVSIDANVSKVTVTFKDAEYEGKNGDVSFTLVNGQNSNAKIPEWVRKSHDLVGWDSSVEGVTVKTALTADVTFTAKWRKYYTVTFRDSEVADITTNEDVTKKVYEDADVKIVDAPSWAKTGYTLSWNSSIEGVNIDSEITRDVTFTAVWAGRTAYTVTYKDAEGGSNADVTETVYDGDKPANVPAWTKEHYTLSWNPSTDVAITADTTFTAVWTEDEKFTVTFKDAEDGTNADVVQTVYINEKATVPNWAKEGYNLVWTSSVDGLTPTSAITADVTFTAEWKTAPKIVLLSFEKSGSKDTTAKYKLSPADSGITVTVSGKVSTTAFEYDVDGDGTKESYANPLKMETTTNVTISGSKGKKVKIVTDGASKKININGTKVATDNTGCYEVAATGNTGDTLVITKADSLNVAVIVIGE